MTKADMINPLLDRMSELYKRLDNPRIGEKRKATIRNTIKKFKPMIDRRMKMNGREM